MKNKVYFIIILHTHDLLICRPGNERGLIKLIRKPFRNLDTHNIMNRRGIGGNFSKEENSKQI